MAYTPIDVMTYSLDNLGLSGKVADFSKDFIFSMNFDGKSYWEKMLLGDMLNQGLKLYPEYKQFLLIDDAEKVCHNTKCIIVYY